MEREGRGEERGRGEENREAVGDKEVAAGRWRCRWWEKWRRKMKRANSSMKFKMNLMKMKIYRIKPEKTDKTDKKSIN